LPQALLDVSSQENSFMLKLSRVGAAVASLLCVATVSTPLTAFGQDVQRIEITGSAIRRIAAEGALPVTVINRSDIERSGATTVTELIQALPAMQGFTTASQSVNGGGGGTTTASLHGLGSGYTLVLLNGRRLAPFTTGSTVNLESLPLSAVERVEVLLDGASSLYGSDAIGGVVNFILRRNETRGEVAAEASLVEQGGGERRSASITKGFGDLGRDGFNVLASLSFDSQNRLRAIDRPFSNSGIVRNIDGRNVAMQLISSNSVPGNVLLLTPNGANVRAFYSPELLRDGSCPELHVRVGNTCRFDFPSQVDLVPDSQRMTGLLSGRAKLGNDHEVFSELVLSRFSTKPTFAPPAQPGLLLTPELYARHVVPLLGQLNLTEADIGTLTDSDRSNDPTYNLRVFDAGGRRDDYKFGTAHWTLGSEGSFAGWDYRGHITLSRQEATDEAIGGYLSANRFNQLIASGAYDPLDARAGSAVQALSPAVLRQELSRNLSTYNSLGVSGSRPLFKLGGGDVSVAVGAEVARQSFQGDPSDILRGDGDLIIGANVGQLPFDTTRASYGVFSEVLWPLTKSLEVTSSLRYDNYGAASNRRPFDANSNPLTGSRTEGKKANAATWKLGMRFQPTRELLLRASAGTGFKAPTLANITNPLQDFGVTSNSYDCPFAATDPLAVGCEPPDSQYNMLTGGNKATDSTALKPERSKQLSLGVVFEPSSDVSLSVDAWQVKIEDVITVIPEAVAFADPVTYRNLFRLVPNPLNNRQQLRLLQLPVNAAMAKNAGIDLRATLRTQTALGKVTTNLAGTYMTKADFTVPGQDGVESSIGKFDVNSNVIFRWQLNGSVTLETGAWTTTVTGNYRSGYVDHEARCADPTLTDAECSAAGLWVGPDIRATNPTTGAIGGRISYRRMVSEYVTFDLQTKYAVNKSLSITAGIKNLFGDAPPLSIQDSGGGNMRGYDGRYADPLGRQWTLRANYVF
jgi:iron complex outermembrane recepter protein